MDTVYQQFRKCGVKIITEIAGGNGFSSGFLYQTSNNSRYNYVFTTKHTLKISHDDDEIYFDVIKYVQIQCYSQNKFIKYDYIPQKELEKRVLVFDDDLVVILVKKNDNFDIPFIQVSDSTSNECCAWATTDANDERLSRLELKINDSEQKTYVIEKWNSSSKLKGCSGSGIISVERPVLYGFIMSYPTDEFQGGYIDAVNISFEKINNKLYGEKYEELSTIDNRKRRIVKDKHVVDINCAPINGVKLNLELAKKRIMFDAADDWFHDPLNFIDLSNEDFLFEYYKDFLVGNEYNVSTAEIFYLPKKSFTLRKAMVISYTDRIYYAALVEVLGKCMDDALSPMIYSARYNKLPENGIMISGVEQWKKMQYKLKDYSYQYKYVIEVDILNFYDNIDIELLCKKILAVCTSINERNAVEELRKTLLAFSKDVKNGIPQNSDVSSLLATFYLNLVDTYMYHHVPVYMRFMDDIRIFCDDVFAARRYLTLIEQELRRINLSINGQKTNIINLTPRKKSEKNNIDEQYRRPFDLEKSKLSRYTNSSRIEYLNEAFHLAVNLLLENMNESSVGNPNSERKLYQAITAVRRCSSKGVKINQESKIEDFLVNAGKLIMERPWVTPQICTMIGILETKYIPDIFWEKAIEIVLDEKYNTYPWQCYHIWLLFAKHRLVNNKLRRYASNYLDKNDETSKPVIAAMMIYMGTIDLNYRRVILRKFNDSFTNGNFQKRIAMIVLRSFESSEISFKNIEDKAVHISLNHFKDKELVYILGERDDSEIDITLLQIYSL
jgi:hypothetical protein